MCFISNWKKVTDLLGNNGATISPGIGDFLAFSTVIPGPSTIIRAAWKDARVRAGEIPLVLTRRERP